jgi:nucleotide-binding universal stress UspA family protein
MPSVPAVTPRRVLVAIDLLDAIPSVAEYGAALARAFDARLEIVYVWQPPHLVSPEAQMLVPGWSAAALEREAMGNAERALRAFMGRVSLPGVATRARIEIGNVTETLLRTAAEEPSTLIVMGTHGRSGLARLAMGSVAQRLVAAAPCPVLTLRPFATADTVTS